MKRIVFHFDPISPFVHLAFERLPQVLQGCSYAVEYRPLLFAGLLQHWGQKGPAEIEPKRAWTFRHVAWLAQRHGISLQTPQVHPFNPLPLLRLAIACGPDRRVVEAILRHVWVGGADAADPASDGGEDRRRTGHEEEAQHYSPEVVLGHLRLEVSPEE